MAITRRAPRPLLAWPERFRLATKANRAAIAEFGAGMQYASAISPHFHDYRSYLESFKKVPFIRSCVTAIAFNCANVSYHLVPETNEPEDLDGELTHSPLLDLLKRPNPYQTGFELRELIFTDLELTGNAFVALEARDGAGRPSELYRLQPDHVVIRGDPRTGIAGYLYTANGRQIPYGPDEVWHQRLPHPFDPLYGMGVVEAMETRADAARAMAEHEARFWQSGAKITGVLSTDDAVDDTVFDRLKGRFRDFLKNAGFSTLILEKGLKYQPVSESLAGLGLVQIHQMARDEILNMFGVPPTKIGIIESANYKALAADQYFWQEVVDPKLTRNEQAMQRLVDLFHPGSGLALRYERLDFSDDAAQAQVAETIQRSYSFTLNELREYQGKEPVAMGDVILIAGRGAPVAIDPETGEATVLGGPQPGEVTVDEASNAVPPVDEAGRPIPPTPLAGAATEPQDRAPQLLPNARRKLQGKALSVKSAPRARPDVAARLKLAKADAERRAVAVHRPALVQAFYAQEQQVRDALLRRDDGLAS